MDPVQGIIINIDPIIFQVGPVAVRWYGLMYVVGFMVGMWVAGLYAPIRRITEDDLWYVFWPSVIAGLLGARLYYVLQSLDKADYLAEPWRIFATWEGGMAFYGAVFAVVPTLYFAARRRGIGFWSMLDAAAFFAVVGQAIGRIGNIINGDIVGFRTDLPWGFVYIHPNSFVPLNSLDPTACVRGVPCQPAALYELLFNLVLFGLMWRMRSTLRKPGSMFVFWLIGYSVGQILLFTLRANDILFLGLKQAQLTAIVVILACIPLAWYLNKRQTPEPVPAAPETMAPDDSNGDGASPGEKEGSQV